MATSTVVSTNSSCLDDGLDLVVESNSILPNSENSENTHSSLQHLPKLDALSAAIPFGICHPNSNDDIVGLSLESSCPNTLKFEDVKNSSALTNSTAAPSVDNVSPICSLVDPTVKGGVTETLSQVSSEVETKTLSNDASYINLDPTISSLLGSRLLTDNPSLKNFMQSYFDSWQAYLEPYFESDSFDASRPHMNPSKVSMLSSSEFQSLPAPLRCMYNMMADMKEMLRSIMTIQQSIVETQSQFNFIINLPVKHLQDVLMQREHVISHTNDSTEYPGYSRHRRSSIANSSQMDLADFLETSRSISPDMGSFIGDGCMNSSSGVGMAGDGNYYSHGRMKRSAMIFDDTKPNDEIKERPPGTESKRGRSHLLRDDAPMPGVRYARDRNSWVAFWCENGRQSYKSFSNKKFGFEKARQLAIAARQAFDCRVSERQVVEEEEEPLMFNSETTSQVPEVETPILSRASPPPSNGTPTMSRSELQQLAASLYNPKGVCYAPSNNTWMAYGSSGSGARMCKSFPVAKYGFYEARDMAIHALQQPGKRKMDKDDSSTENLDLLTNSTLHMDSQFEGIDMEDSKDISLRSELSTSNFGDQEYLAKESEEKWTYEYEPEETKQLALEFCKSYGLQINEDQHLVASVAISGVKAQADEEHEEYTNQEESICENNNQTRVNEHHCEKIASDASVIQNSVQNSLLKYSINSENNSSNNITPKECAIMQPKPVVEFCNTKEGYRVIWRKGEEIHSEIFSKLKLGDSEAYFLANDFYDKLTNRLVHNVNIVDDIDTRLCSIDSNSTENGVVSGFPPKTELVDCI